MKKLLLSLALVSASLPALAQHYGYWHRHGHWNHRGDWVAPLIIGGVVGAVIANNRQQETIVLQNPPMIIQNPPVYVQRQTVCTEWREIQNPDGTIYRERTCTN